MHWQVIKKSISIGTLIGFVFSNSLFNGVVAMGSEKGFTHSFFLQTNKDMIRVPFSSKTSKDSFKDRFDDTALMIPKELDTQIDASRITRRQFLSSFTIGALSVAFLPGLYLSSAVSSQTDLLKGIAKWVTNNVAPDTGVLLSFQIPKDKAGQIWQSTRESQSEEDSVHERMILSKGLYYMMGLLPRYS